MSGLSWPWKEAAEMLGAIPDSPSCRCPICVASCRRPCWPTPEEAERLMDAGYADRLMLDYWGGDSRDTLILCPATPSREGKSAPLWPDAGCVFQGSDGACALHDPGLKPCEGRKTGCIVPGGVRLHELVAATWNSRRGRFAVARWRDLMEDADGS